MTVRLALSGLVLGVLFLSNVKAGVIEISAYGTVSSQGYSQMGNRSDESPGTSRSMSRGGGYKKMFDGLLTRPVFYGTSSSQDSYKIPKYIVYPSNSQSVYPPQPLKQAVASDRFAPGEAYGGTVYKILKAKQEKQKGYQYQKPSAAFADSKAKPSAAAAASPPPPPPRYSPPPPPPPAPITPPQLPPIIVGPTPVPSTTPANPTVSETNIPAAPAPDAPPSMQYIPPSELNLFAPNIHSHYPPPPASGETRFNGITSYLPPAAGPVADDSSADSNLPDSPPSNQYIPPAELFQFPPNIHSHYHPPPMGDNFHTNGLTSYLPPPAGPADAYLPPSSGMSADSSASGQPSSQDSSDDMIGTIPIGPDSPYPGYLPPSGPQRPAAPGPKPQMMMGMLPNQNMMMDMPPSKDMMMMSMPPGPPMSGPPMDSPFDFHGYENYYPHDHFPEYIFDHDHDHYHHDEPPPTTTPAPPPPPPPADGRVKNYSYYKISRALWYIPLYFTIYFVVYILILILRSVARHKVNYPNQWTGRYLGVTNPLYDMQFITNEQAMYKTEMMTQFVMKQIEDFKEKNID